MSGTYCDLVYHPWSDPSGSYYGGSGYGGSGYGWYELEYDPHKTDKQFIEQKVECPFCRNDSGFRDDRGMCISCGGRLNAK